MRRVEMDQLADFVNRHENRVYRTALAIMGNKTDAEDIMQEIFFKVISNTPVFESEKHETAWLTRVTVNQCRSLLRSSWWRKTEPLLDTYPAQNDTEQDLIEIVQKLPQKYRIAIYLFYYEGYSIKEIAEITSQKESTVKSHLKRAREKLRDYLEDENFERNNKNNE